MVLSWVGFWLNREATSDRVTLGVTAVLTLSAISMDSRSDLPKVHYATALDWFIICSFLYCMASILEFAGVHYFTKVGYGESFGQTSNYNCNNDVALCDEDDMDREYDDDWEDMEEWGTSDPPISVSSRWSTLPPQCPPPPWSVPNHVNHVAHVRPPTPSFAFNHLYGVNDHGGDHGSLSDSTESLPAPARTRMARLSSKSS